MLFLRGIIFCYYRDIFPYFRLRSRFTFTIFYLYKITNYSILFFQY